MAQSNLLQAGKTPMSTFENLLPSLPSLGSTPPAAGRVPRPPPRSPRSRPAPTPAAPPASPARASAPTVAPAARSRSSLCPRRRPAGPRLTHPLVERRVLKPPPPPRHDAPPFRRTSPRRAVRLGVVLLIQAASPGAGAEVAALGRCGAAARTPPAGRYGAKGQLDQQTGCPDRQAQVTKSVSCKDAARRRPALRRRQARVPSVTPRTSKCSRDAAKTAARALFPAWGGRDEARWPQPPRQLGRSAGFVRKPARFHWSTCRCEQKIRRKSRGFRRAAPAPSTHPSSSTWLFPRQISRRRSSRFRLLHRVASRARRGDERRSTELSLEAGQRKTRCVNAGCRPPAHARKWATGQGPGRSC
eukprot:366388-Chlamydomonas_euryale.AAC.6